MSASVHRYSARSLAGDYARAGLGVALTGAPLLLVSPGSSMIWVLAPLAILFGAFGLRTAGRQATRVEMSDEGIRSTGPFGAAISWERLDVLRLRYYSSKRGRSRPADSDGWLQLVLGGDGRKLRIDSALSDFDAVLARASSEAKRRGLALDDATRHNLQALGLIAEGAP